MSPKNPASSSIAKISTVEEWMIAPSRNANYFLLGTLCALASLLQSVPAFAQTVTASPVASAALQSATPRDGQHDFDFEMGTWKIHLKRMQHPLAGSTTWVEFDGTVAATKSWDGRENA